MTNISRNIAIVGHVDAGKTELVHQIEAAAPLPVEIIEIPSDAILDFWDGWPVWTWRVDS